MVITGLSPAAPPVAAVKTVRLLSPFQVEIELKAVWVALSVIVEVNFTARNVGTKVNAAT